MAKPLLALAGLAVLAACGSPSTTRTPATSATQQIRGTTPPGPPSDPWGPWIREASARFDVPEAWIREVMRQESGGRPGVTSRAGAMGLMQVMPGTYRELQARYGLGPDPYHPYDSLMAGTAYIRQMYDLFGSPAFLAAYNAGPGRLEGFLYNRRGLPAETRNYVARVGPGVIRHSPLRRAPDEVYAAAEIPLRVPEGPRRMDANTRMALAEQRQIREQGAMYAARTPPPAPMPAAAPPVVLASAQVPAPAPVISASGGRVLPDGRIVVAAMDPIPDGSTPEGAARLAEAEGSLPALSAPAVAALQPPVAARPAPRSLGLIGSAQAGTLPAGFGQLQRPVARPQAIPVALARPVPAPASGWAVQVGAFRSPEQARRAAAAAQTQARSGGVVQVMAVQVSQGTLFRARVVGLSEAAAQQTCTRLGARGGCAVVAPE